MKENYIPTEEELKAKIEELLGDNLKDLFPTEVVDGVFKLSEDLYTGSVGMEMFNEALADKYR